MEGDMKKNFDKCFVDTPGTFQGEFEVTYATGEIETFPNDGFLAIEIIDDIA